MADNFIKDTLKDILRHTHNLGIFEMLKISGDATETKLVTVDVDQTVIFIAKTLNPVPEFVDATIGWNRLQILDGNLKIYDGENDTVSIVNEERNGVDTPTEVAFKSEYGNTSNFRFMPASIVEAHLGGIEYAGSDDFDITITPTDRNLKDLTAIFSVLGSFENSFVPKVDDGKLYFHIGDEGSDRSKVLINEAPGGELDRDFVWNLDVVLKILRLGDKANIEMCFSKQGILKITVNSGIGEYNYYLPAQG